MLGGPAGESVRQVDDDGGVVGRARPRSFVAVDEGQPVADAATHDQLVEKLRVLGKSPKGMLVVQAGVEYPQSATIFGTARN